MRPIEPLLLAPCFPPLSQHLELTLNRLSAADWQCDTICPGWSVKDIAAHLLDTALRRLSMQRDGHQPPPPDRDLDSYPSLLGFLNQLNADWVQAYRRVSAQIVRDQLLMTDKALTAFVQTLDPFSPALFSVAWAGEAASLCWFDIAREYTERWLHLQQICDATGQPDCLAPAFYLPYLQTSALGLPHGWRGMTPPDGTTVRVEVEGLPDAAWLLVYEKGWQVYYAEAQDTATTTITLLHNEAWKLLSKGLKTRAALEKAVSIAGKAEWAEPIYSYVAVMA